MTEKFVSDIRKQYDKDAEFSRNNSLHQVSTFWRAPDSLGGNIEHLVAYFNEYVEAKNYSAYQVSVRRACECACPEWCVVLDGVLKEYM